jgi:3-methylcrotonyl-CoA carboxylase beta subunit
MSRDTQSMTEEKTNPGHGAEVKEHPAIPPSLRTLVERVIADEEQICLGGGKVAIQRQHDKGRLTARERILELIDDDSEFLELGIYAAFEMYEEWGGAPAAGVIA